LLAGYINQTEKLDYRLIGTAIKELEGNIDA
jgi:hypothetical protein